MWRGKETDSPIKGSSSLDFKIVNDYILSSVKKEVGTVCKNRCVSRQKVETQKVISQITNIAKKKMKNALGELMRTPRTAKNVESGGSWVETSSISKQTEEGREQQQ